MYDLLHSLQQAHNAITRAAKSTEPFDARTTDTLREIAAAVRALATRAKAEVLSKRRAPTSASRSEKTREFMDHFRT